MSIEWDKIKENPNKSHKIEGVNLLNLKLKIESQEKSISELTQNIEELTAKNNSLEEKITNLESESQEKTGKIASLEEKINELDGSISQTKKEVESSTTELETKNQTISELENSVSNKQEEIKNLNEYMSAANEKISEIQDQMNVKNNEIQTLESKNSELENETSKLNENISELQNRLSDKDASSSENENKINALQNQTSELQEEIKGKDREIDELNQKIETLNTNIAELKEQIPKKPVYAKAEQVVKGGKCPKCGFPTYEEYRMVEGKRQLIRKYCPNTSCGWSKGGEEQLIAITMTEELPEEEKKVMKIFWIKKGGIEETEALNSKMVAVIADPDKDIIWIWKGKDSSRFDYADATNQATHIKNEVVKMFHARIERAEEGKEPENFPQIGE